LLLLGLIACEAARQMELRGFYRSYEHQAEKIAIAISSASIDSIAAQDVSTLETTVLGIIDNVPDVAAMAIYNPNKQLLASWGEDIINLQENSASVFSHQSPVLKDNEYYGELAIAFNITDESALFRRDMINIYLIGSAIAAVTALWVMFILNNMVLNPLRRIHTHLLCLQNDEKPGELKLATTKELHHLGKTVNALGNVLELSKQKKQELEKASRAKSDFLANMSHELRTPMNGVLGMLDLLKTTELNPQQSEQARIAISSGKSLLTLINDILDLSKLEAGKLEYENINFCLEALIEECAEALAESAHAKGVEFICTIAPDIPLNVVGDPTRLRQVLTNLTSNAVKFTNEGIVEIQITKAETRTTSDTIRFAINDTGVGMCPETIKKLFSSFAQADSSTTRKFGGTGLGLAISRKLIEGMGGQIGVESVENKGSLFWITLTLPAADKATVSAANQLDIVDGKRVLMIEHEEATSVALARLLSEHNLELHQASCGAAALELLHNATEQQLAFDVVLFSTQLQDMSARDFLSKYDSTGDSNKAALIAVNTVSQARTNLYAHTNDKITAHISKPARRSELSKALSVALNEKISTSANSVNQNGDAWKSWRTNAQDKQFIKESGISQTTNVVDRTAKIAQSECVTTTTAKSKYANANLLIVEDNLVNQQVVIGILELAGYNYLIADNGQEALQVLAEHSVDLVLMDCQMPVLDGYETTRIIRHQENTKNLPVIALTANAMQGDADKCYAAGMNAYLSKPIEQRVLIESIETMLSNHADQHSDTRLDEKKAA